MIELNSQSEEFVKFLEMKMPFGKYKGSLLINLPESYLVWFRQKGFPKGKLGEQLQLMYEIRLNGLEYLLKPSRAIK
jgi:uncharacterized protein (DUF3820 family)